MGVGASHRIGETVASRFRLIALLGEGGFGVAYRAWDAKQGVPVVLKQPLAKHLRRPDVLQRFDREIGRLIELVHPHIVPIVDHGYDADGLPYLAMRFLPAGSLADRDMPAPVAHVHSWLPGVAAALDFVHSKGILHRDIKPANIFFDTDSVPFLGDFGIAKIVDEGLAEQEEDTLTNTGAAIGTFPYMAPEFFRKPRTLTAAYDQYALAVTVFETVAGKRPFTGDATQLVLAHATETPPDLAKLVKGVPRSLAAAVDRALSKHPQERFGSCREFAAAAIADVPATEKSSSRRRFLCPACQKLVWVPVDFQGRECKCPFCTARLRVAPRLDALWRSDEDPSTQQAKVGGTAGAALIDAASPAWVECPFCRLGFFLPADFQGRTYKCPHHGGDIPVPLIVKNQFPAPATPSESSTQQTYPEVVGPLESSSHSSRKPGASRHPAAPPWLLELAFGLGIGALVVAAGWAASRFYSTWRIGDVDRLEQSPQGAIAGNQAAVLEPSDRASKTEGSRSKPAAEDASNTVSAPRSAVRDEAMPVEGKGAMRTDQRDRRADVGFGSVDTGRIKWSALISEETLTNEIRSQLPRLAGVVGSPAVFKSGGNGGAREGFSVVALMFGVIAAYDQDVRWKKDAPVFRDLFARAGFICTVATNQSFSESKARVVDLESLLAGGSLDGIEADQDEDFRWSQVAALSQLVLRLEAAVNAISDAEVAVSKGNFRNRVKHLPKLLHEAEVVAVIGEVIQQPDFEYHDDDTYRGYASSMRDAAICARDAANKGDGDTMRAAVAELKKSCEALHAAYVMLEVKGQ